VNGGTSTSNGPKKLTILRMGIGTRDKVADVDVELDRSYHHGEYCWDAHWRRHAAMTKSNGAQTAASPSYGDMLSLLQMKRVRTTNNTENCPVTMFPAMDLLQCDMFPV